MSNRRRPANPAYYLRPHPLSMAAAAMRRLQEKLAEKPAVTVARARKAGKSEMRGPSTLTTFDDEHGANQ